MLSALICYTRTREYSGKFSSQQDADLRCSAGYIRVEIPRNQQLRQHLKTNRVLETIIVIRPITGAILITDPPPRPRLMAGNNDSSSGANDSLSPVCLVITRKCNSSIGNYPGVSFTVVIATNLDENAQHSLLSIICSRTWAQPGWRITVTQSGLATIIHSNIWMTNMMRCLTAKLSKLADVFSLQRPGNVCRYNSILSLWEIYRMGILR